MNPNVLIVVLDAVRAQNLPMYGYPRNTTPFLCSVKDDLAIYENAVSSSYWTMPSIAALLTGMYASSHGLIADGQKLDASLHTLPAILKRRGYRTAGFVRNVYVSEYSGLERGFGEFRSEYWLDSVIRVLARVSKNLVHDLRPPGITRPSVETARRGHSRKKKILSLIARCSDVLVDRGSGSLAKCFAEWVKEDRSRPFFAYFHIFETHSPYRAPGGCALDFLSLRENLGKLFINHDHLDYLLGRSPMTPEHFRILESAYDNSIRYADHVVERLFGSLERNGLLDDTLVVILADHGENIGDHGMMFHYFCLYDTLIKIPLLLRFPRHVEKAGRFKEVVQNVDVFPTILSLLSVEDEDVWRQVEGNDLLGLARPKRDEGIAISELIKVFGPDRNRYKAELRRFDRRLLSLRTRDRKFIYSSRGDHECYDLRQDPGERENLYPRDGTFADLEIKARDHYDRMNDFYLSNRETIDGDAGPDRLDGSVADKLRSLGYM